MKKDKLLYFIFGTYLLSFLLLVFKYIEYDSTLRFQLTAVQKKLGLSTVNLNLFILFVGMIYSIILVLVYYKAIEMILVRVEKMLFSGEYLLVSILISESLCQVFALLFIGILDMTILRFMLPIIGLLSLGILLYKKYPVKFIAISLAIRALFYFGNVIVLVFGLIK